MSDPEMTPALTAERTLVSLANALDTLESLPENIDAIELEIIRSRINTLCADVWHHHSMRHRHSQPEHAATIQ